jgi:hypothetical protein
MNERIDEIAFESGCHKNKYCDPKHPNLEGFIINEAALDKFAELIVRECLNVVDDMANPDDSDRYFWAIQNVSQTIKKHFGVEE